MTVPWLARVTRRRASSDARLLLVVLAVAIVASTMVSSLALLVTVTEQAGLRSTLGAEAAVRNAIEVRVADPIVPVAAVESSAASAVDFVLAGVIPSDSTVQARTALAAVDGLGDQKPVLAYFGEHTRIESAATIVAGNWPAEDATRSPLPVAVPESAAEALGLVVGDGFVTDGTATEVVGVYRIDDAENRYWSADPLDGSGFERDFPLPGASVYIATDALGPLVVAPQALDDAGLVVQSVDLRFDPDFAGLRIDDLGVLSERLDEARSRVPVRVGAIAGTVAYSSDLSDTVEEAASGLLVTRSTVITAALILLLVAVVALVQSARLVTDSRIDERRLLLARGASLAGIRGMTAMEAAVVVAVVAAVSPLLATLVYRLVAAHPAMAAAGVPADPGLPPLLWGVALGTAVLFMVVLLVPLVRPVELFDDERGEQRAGRRTRSLGLVRLGIDAGIAAIAIVLYQQLVAYRAPIGQTTVRVDPLLVVTPVLLLAACSLLAVRLVPVVAAAVEFLGGRLRGAVMSLASWEVGRRAQRATAVVLLLTLALAVGSFGATFLGTWRQSQVDQAALAFGAPARAPVDPDGIRAQAAELGEGARDRPQPVLRRFGRVAGPSAIGSGTLPPSGPSAQILGLTASARSMLDRGRVGTEGGTVIERMLRAEVPPSAPIPLSGSAGALAATVRIGEPEQQVPGVVATVSAVLEDDGILSSVGLGIVPVDGADYEVQAKLPPTSRDAAGGRPTSGLVGFVVDFTVGDIDVFQLRDQSTPATVLVRDIATRGSSAADASAEPVLLDGAAGWVPRAPTRYETAPTVVEPPAGWQLALALSIPSDVDGRRATYSLTGWDDAASVPVVAAAGLAQQMALRPGSGVTLVVGQAQIPAELVGTAPLVPGSSRSPGVAESSNGDQADTTTGAVVVVDQTLLSRYLITAGLEGAAVDEWWVDVAPGEGSAYVDRHSTGDDRVDAESSEVLATELTEGPLRIALPAALTLVIAATAMLAVIGFAVHTAAAMRARRTEFAQLRAIGLPRRALIGVVGAESVLLSLLGTVFGLGIGVLLGSVVAPLIGSTPDGSAPTPSVSVVVPVPVIAGLAGLIAVVIVAVVLTVAGRQRSADPAAILRGTGE